MGTKTHGGGRQPALLKRGRPLEADIQRQNIEQLPAPSPA